MEEVFTKIYAVITINGGLSVADCMTDEPVITYGTKKECESYIAFINNLNKDKS